MCQSDRYKRLLQRFGVAKGGGILGEFALCLKFKVLEFHAPRQLELNQLR